MDNEQMKQRLLYLKKDFLKKQKKLENFEKRSSAREHVRQKIEEQARLSAAAEGGEPAAAGSPKSECEVKVKRSRSSRKPLVHFNLPGNVVALSPDGKAAQGKVIEEEEEILREQRNNKQKEKTTDGLKETCDDISQTVTEINSRGVPKSPRCYPAKKLKMTKKKAAQLYSAAEPEIGHQSAEVSKVVSKPSAIDTLDDCDIIGSSQVCDHLSPVYTPGARISGRKRLQTPFQNRKRSPVLSCFRKDALISSRSPVVIPSDSVQEDAGIKNNCFKLNKFTSPSGDEDSCNLRQADMAASEQHRLLANTLDASDSGGQQSANVITQEDGESRLKQNIAGKLEDASCSACDLGVNDLGEKIQSMTSAPNGAALMNPDEPASGDSATRVTTESDSLDSCPIPDTQYVVNNKTKKRKSLSKSRSKNCTKSSACETSPPLNLHDIDHSTPMYGNNEKTAQSHHPEQIHEFAFENDFSIICGAGENLPIGVRKQKSAPKAGKSRPIRSENNLVMGRLNKCKSEKSVRRSSDVCDYAILVDDDGDMYSQIKSRRSRRARHSWAPGGSQDLQLSQAIQASLSTMGSEASIDTMEMDGDTSCTADAGRTGKPAGSGSKSNDSPLTTSSHTKNTPIVETEGDAVRLLVKRTLIDEGNVRDFSLAESELSPFMKKNISYDETKSTMECLLSQGASNIEGSSESRSSSVVVLPSQEPVALETEENAIRLLFRKLLVSEGKVRDFSLPGDEYGSLLKKHESDAEAKTIVQVSESQSDFVESQKGSNMDESQETQSSNVIIAPSQDTWSESQGTQDSNPNIRRHARGNSACRQRRRGRGRGRGRGRKQSQSSHYSDLSTTQSEESQSLLVTGILQGPILSPDLDQLQQHISSIKSPDKSSEASVEEHAHRKSPDATNVASPGLSLADQEATGQKRRIALADTITVPSSQPVSCLCCGTAVLQGRQSTILAVAMDSRVLLWQANELQTSWEPLHDFADLTYAHPASSLHLLSGDDHVVMCLGSLVEGVAYATVLGYDTPGQHWSVQLKEVISAVAPSVCPLSPCTLCVSAGRGLWCLSLDARCSDVLDEVAMETPSDDLQAIIDIKGQPNALLGTSKSAIYIWNALHGWLLWSVDMGVCHLRAPVSAQAEGGFVFVWGTLAKGAPGGLMVLNPGTSKCAHLHWWEESALESDANAWLSVARCCDGLIAGLHDDGSVVFWSTASGGRLARYAAATHHYQAVSMLSSKHSELNIFLSRAGAVDVYSVDITLGPV